MADQSNPYSMPPAQGPQAPQRKDPKLNPELSAMAENDPVGYVAHMQALGRGDELEPEDHIRAATTGFWNKLTGGK